MAISVTAVVTFFCGFRTADPKRTPFDPPDVLTTAPQNYNGAVTGYANIGLRVEEPGPSKLFP